MDNEESPLESLIKQRLHQITGRIDFVRAEAEKYCKENTDERESIQKAQICASKLENLIQRFTSELNEYFRLSVNPSPDEISEMTSIQLNGEEMLAELKCIVANKLVTLKEVTNDKVSRSFSAKLPTLSLPNFEGDVLTWCEYWDIYKSNIHDRSIADVDKLLYLKSTLKGEPRKIIEGLETTNSNYVIAIDILTKRYGKSSQIIDAHYSALSKVKAAVSAIDDCRVTLNEIERHLRVLQSLGENINHNHLRFLITEKFPADIIYDMKIKMKEDTVEEMRRHLEAIISAREEANRIRHEKSTSDNNVIAQTVETLHVTHRDKRQMKNKSGRKHNTNFKTDIDTRKQVVKREENNIGNKKRDWTMKRKFESSGEKRDKDRVTEKGDERKRRRLSCIFCEGDHFPDQCQQFKTVEERKAKLKNRCYNCLSEHHFFRFCKSKRRCVYCHKSGQHNRALCSKKFRTKNETTLTVADSGEFTILQTAVVMAKNEKDCNKPIKCRLLLDSGSQRSYVTREMSKRLNLPILEENKLSIFGFAKETPHDLDSPRVKLEITTKTNKVAVLYVNEVPTITKGVVSPKVSLGKYIDKTLADDGSLGDKVDILVGNDYYFDFISTEKLRVQENLYLINSEFGWIISGKANIDDNENTLSFVTYCQNHDPNCVYFTEPDLPLKNMDLSFLWSLESIGITDNPKATREEEAIKHLNETIIYKDGRYMVKWPWVQYPPEMPTNYGLAYGRLKGLLQRLNEDTVKEYQNIFEEQLNNGIIEVIDPEEDVYTQRIPPIHYLPHHMIKQDGKKGRIVYDASGKLKEKKSLNDCMYKGPSMIGDLVGLLIQFRTHKVAISADVEKAFLQIGLQEDDRDVTRFIWIKDLNEPLSKENIIHLRFCRVPFGIIASPFLLTATLKYHMSQNAPELTSKIVDKCYVDNLVTGTNSTQEAKELYRMTRKIFKEMNMNIRDWVSNQKAFLDSIPSEHKAKQTEETKILGLIWNTNKDTLKLNIKQELFKEDNITESQTKRKILSTIASMYDPCGLCCPLILPAKLLLQHLWEIKLKWDVELPDDLQEKWEDIIHRLKAINKVEIPRYIGFEHGKVEYELHGFSDASKQAYACVIYLTACYKKERKTTFVMAKSKLVPKEERDNLRIPRLELLGCYLCSKLITYIKSVIELRITKEYLWTDSQIVMTWVQSNKLLPPFIARRVNAIKENKQLELRYVNTDLNPADLATRPDIWEKKETLWFNGPTFLKQGEEDWPSQTLFDIPSSSLGQGPSETTNLMEVDDKIPDKTIQQENMDSVVKTCRVENAEANNNAKKIKDLQKEYFAQESEGKRTSLAINLDLFKDIDGILRCKGRMKNTNWSFDKRYPVLIPRDCEFTNDLVMKTHKENYHMGVNHTLSTIRQSYWIPKGKSYVQRILKRCPECIKHNGGPFKLPPAPALPAERVNYTAPFTYTGVDYMGPLVLNDGISKRWICLFTCLVVRAVHLEVVHDLTAEEGLLALRRMISTRGIPTLVTSDNALHFKLMAEILSDQYCIDKKIRWRFITPLSPWAGGFYERLIGIVKNCMKKTLVKHKLKDNQLSTIIKEIEAVVNSRPLTSIDSETDHILRPSDFLTVGRVITVEGDENSMEPKGISTTKTELIKGWKRALNILNEFKDMFANHYLLALRERYSHLPREPRITSKLTPSPGQVVQIKGETKDRNEWKVGKITALIPSTDGLCRAAKVQVGKSEYTRSIAHLYPLEIEDTPDRVMDITDTKEESRPLEKPNHDTEIIDMPEEVQPQITDVFPSHVSMPEEIVTSETIDDQEVVSKDEEGEYASSDKNESNTVDAIDTNQKPRRAAASRAIEKIKEWTRDLTALLLYAVASPPGSVVSSTSSPHTCA